MVEITNILLPETQGSFDLSFGNGIGEHFIFLGWIVHLSGNVVTLNEAAWNMLLLKIL